VTQLIAVRVAVIIGGVLGTAGDRLSTKQHPEAGTGLFFHEHRLHYDLVDT
jgi:hypothetical protein